MAKSPIPRIVSTPVPHLVEVADSRADTVAECIEAGYDEQSDASVRPLANDPASAKDGEIKDIE